MDMNFLCSLDATEHTTELARVELHVGGFGVEVEDPTKRRAIETLVENAIARLVGEEDLCPVGAAVEEHEEGARARVRAELGTYGTSESVEGATEIDRCGGDEDARAGWDHEEPSIARTRRVSWLASMAAEKRSRRAPPRESSSRSSAAGGSSTSCTTGAAGAG